MPIFRYRYLATLVVLLLTSQPVLASDTCRWLWSRWRGRIEYYDSSLRHAHDDVFLSRAVNSITWRVRPNDTLIPAHGTLVTVPQYVAGFIRNNHQKTLVQFAREAAPIQNLLRKNQIQSEKLSNLYLPVRTTSMMVKGAAVKISYLTPEQLYLIYRQHHEEPVGLLRLVSVQADIAESNKQMQVPKADVDIYVEVELYQIQQSLLKLLFHQVNPYTDRDKAFYKFNPEVKTPES